uniref:Ribosomal protein L5 n=1 Tax=Tupiella akineta TaxID=160070 RepID=Q6UVT8_TUPAK|nr:ribosomal protein L5 [Tupiella akineta]AAQ18736.1 ribosomal protein L5 [Tupiella akineta]
MYKKLRSSFILIIISTMSNRTKISLIRSRNFVGHLNKNWIERDLPRYQLTFGGWQTNEDKKNNVNLPAFVFPVGKVNKDLASSWKARGFPKDAQKRLKVLNSYGLEKIILHSSSGKLLQAPSSSTTIDLAFSTVGCQTPTKVYSRRSIAGFKLSKSALLGAKATLRNLAKYDFFYKFYFLGAGETNVTAMTRQSRITLGEQKLAAPYGLQSIQQQPNLSTTSLAVKNVFLFNELDSLDYDVFSNMAGFEIVFINRRS